jgi:NADH-quinone oxidoreductase subunit A
MTVLERYALIGLFGFAALTFPIVPLILAFLFRPKKPNERKQATYECGLEIEDLAPEAQNVWVQFRVQYYIYALLFVVFDIEVVFLYPWAVASNATTQYLFWFGEMAIFLLILIGALAYAWRKRLLEWI